MNHGQLSRDTTRKNDHLSEGNPSHKWLLFLGYSSYYCTNYWKKVKVKTVLIISSCLNFEINMIGQFPLILSSHLLKINLGVTGWLLYLSVNHSEHNVWDVMYFLTLSMCWKNKLYNFFTCYSFDARRGKFIAWQFWLFDQNIVFNCISPSPRGCGHTRPSSWKANKQIKETMKLLSLLM